MVKEQKQKRKPSQSPPKSSSSSSKEKGKRREIEFPANTSLDTNLSELPLYSAENVARVNATKDDMKKSRKIRNEVSDKDKVFNMQPDSINKFKRCGGNIGFAKYNINEEENKFLLSASGIDNPLGLEGDYAPYVENDKRKLKAVKANEDIDTTVRDKDTEAKILEELLSQTTPEYEGKIRLFTERDVCSSCANIIKQFAAERPKSKIEVVEGKKTYNGSPISDV